MNNLAGAVARSANLRRVKRPGIRRSAKVGLGLVVAALAVQFLHVPDSLKFAIALVALIAVVYTALDYLGVQRLGHLTARVAIHVVSYVVAVTVLWQPLARATGFVADASPTQPFQVNIVGTNTYDPKTAIILSNISGDAISNLRIWGYTILAADVLNGSPIIRVQERSACDAIPTLPNQGDFRTSLSHVLTSHLQPNRISQADPVKSLFVYAVYTDPKSGRDREWSQFYWRTPAGWRVNDFDPGYAPFGDMIGYARRLCKYNGR
jgi:hypothetical protein